MPNQIHRRTKELIIMAAVLGIGVGGTTVFAEHARPLRADTETGQISHYRNNDLSGGFYDDRYKRDNWYYDFYESRGATRTSSYTADGRAVDLTDAAHPRTMGRSTANDQSMVYQQYYDEPWFYNQRDPSYGMPMARSGDPIREPAVQSDNMVKGTVNAVKQVRNRTTGEQNTVALIKTADKRSVIADLGSTRSTLDMALSKGDNIWVAGQWEDVGDYSVLMAQQVKSGANRVLLHRGSSAVSPETRRVEGRIQQFRDIRVNRTGELHRTAAVQTMDGRYSIIDLGPTASDSMITGATPGDRIVADGRVIDVGNYPVLLANQVSINDGSPVRIARPTGSMESAPRTMPTDPSCVGGGCTGQGTTSHGQTRDPHTNATDGTIR